MTVACLPVVRSDVRCEARVHGHVLLAILSDLTGDRETHARLAPPLLQFELVPRLAFILTWSLLNFLWLALLRRPVLSAALSLAIVIVLIEISRFKFRVLFMTASFIDVMVIDSETFTYIAHIFHKVRCAA